MLNLNAYHQIRLGGRFILSGNSGDIHWLNEGKDNSFPLLPVPDLEPDSVTLLLEAKGYFCYPIGSEFNWEEVGPYERLDVQFLGFQLSQLT